MEEERLPYSGRKVADARLVWRYVAAPKPRERKTEELGQHPAWARRLTGKDWDIYINAYNKVANATEKGYMMARERSFTVLESDKLREHRQIDVKIGDNDDGSPKVVKADYWVPNSPSSFQEFVLSLTGETLAEAYMRYVTAVDSSARQSVRESQTPETTVIMVNGQKVDVMEYPMSKLIFAVNSFAGVAYSTGKDMPGAFRVARERLLSKGTVTEIDNPAGEGPKLISVVK